MRFSYIFNRITQLIIKSNAFYVTLRNVRETILEKS
jgi:hypothetical protein